jgi:hypothetical protein
MNDAVTAFISGFIIIMFGAVFYVLWDNSCKKFHEFEKRTIERLDALDLWMDVIEESIYLNNNNISDIKECRAKYEECKLKIIQCVKKP